jgi:hypothetical protein
LLYFEQNVISSHHGILVYYTNSFLIFPQHKFIGRSATAATTAATAAASLTTTAATPTATTATSAATAAAASLTTTA